MDGELYITQQQTNFKVHPAKFTLWLFLVAITMMFAAFTSAMLVVKPDAVANDVWATFEIPSFFTYSSIIILLSSVSLQWAYHAAKKNELPKVRIGLLITFILGAAFLASQAIGFMTLIDRGIYFSGLVTMPDGRAVSPIFASYFYLIPSIHALHIIGGLIFLGFTLVSAMRYRVHSRSLLRINLCTTYWHFIGALWVYLFVLLNLYR